MKLGINDSLVVCVDAKEQYSSEPQLEVAFGEIYSFSASREKSWVDWFWRSSAGGFWNPALLRPFKRVKNAKCFELCGTIGRNEDHHFKIGFQLENYKVEADGELYFFPNDSFKHYGNNKGNMKLTVERTG